VAELVDLGFNRAPSQVALRVPGRPPYQGKGDVQIAQSVNPQPGTRAKSIRVARAAVTRSLRPVARSVATADPVLLAAREANLEAVIADLENATAPEPELEPVLETVAAAAPEVAAPEAAAKPVLRPQRVVAAAAQVRDVPTLAQEAEVVTRISTSGGRHWGINVGRYPNRFTAEKVLLKTALSETATLDGSLRKVRETSRGYDANFMGLTREMAEMACRRLQARQVSCFMIGPG